MPGAQLLHGFHSQNWEKTLPHSVWTNPSCTVELFPGQTPILVQYPSLMLWYSGKDTILLGHSLAMTNIAMENGPVKEDLPNKMAIFYSYGSFPDGKSLFS